MKRASGLQRAPFGPLQENGMFLHALPVRKVRPNQNFQMGLQSFPFFLVVFNKGSDPRSLVKSKF